MLEIIKQLALDAAEKGADFCVGTVTKAAPLTIRLEEGLELTEAFLVLTEDVLQAEETGSIQIEGGSWRAYRLKRSRALQAGEAVALLRADGGQQIFGAWESTKRKDRMTPIQETEIDMEKLEKRTMPSLTWRINEEKAEVRGETDELDAMRQAVSKILQTERYRYAVYDWNYGVELEDLYGKNVSYVIPELKRRIEDALLADDRVTVVTDFSFREEKGSVTAAFTVYTIFGEVTAERTVDI